MNKNNFLFLLIALAFSCQKKSIVTSDPAMPRDKINLTSDKKNVWVFILAGQSNMAGRGIIEHEDTIPDSRILTLDRNNNWVIAKEPLHFYEPKLTGLDCGLSFAKTLLHQLDEGITIALVPCAVGGSAVEQWLGDSTHRGVKLFSNFKAKTNIALKYGTIKGVLWHQGESNANKQQFITYRKNLATLFAQFRTVIENDSLPIFVGELGAFLKREDYNTYPDSLNNVLYQISKADPNVMVVKTKDLSHKGDFVHFDSESQRVLGRRYVDVFMKWLNNK